MARATVLGKRKAADSNPAFTYETRKRRAVQVAVLNDENDENVDPETLPDANHDGPEDFENACCETPSKHATRAGRVALSATTINSHFTLAKSTSYTSEKQLLATPQTPRHHDALSKTSTPKHQVRVTARLPLTPRTSRTPGGTATTVYYPARQLFMRSSNVEQLVGRDEERATISTFVQDGISSMSGRSLYISGPPGTGKSAFVSSVCDTFRGQGNVKMVYLNCMSVKSSQDLCNKLAEGLCEGQQTEKVSLGTLRNIFLPKKQTKRTIYIVTLDEVDHLLTLNFETLYTLFEWALDKSSNLILIGIANALDLTDRFLPRLKAKNLRPQLLPFVPYTVSQISAVITTKLRTLLPSDPPDANFVPFVHPAAITLCAKKVASQSGDLRKAFDIMRRTIDVVEAEVKAKDRISSLESSPSAERVKRVLAEKINLSSITPPTPKSTVPTPSTSPATSCLAGLTETSAPRATLSHLSKVTSAAFSSNNTTCRLKTLNLQQKACLCAVLAHEKRRSAQASRDFFLPTPTKTANKADAGLPTVRKLFECYTGLCKREAGGLQTLSATEFADVVGSLEGAGLVRVEGGKGTQGGRKGKGGGFGIRQVKAEERRVGGCVSEKEVEGVLEGVVGELLRGLLRGVE